jgi:hypothetical protein
MNDTSLYQQILGDTSPWKVDSVRLDAKTLTVEVFLSVDSKTLWACPECRERMHIKEWRSRRNGCAKWRTQ